MIAAIHLGRRRHATAVGLAFLAALLVGCGSAPTGPAALSEFSDSLRSQAAEGAILAHDAAAGDSTTIFTHEHARDLVDVASQVKDSLATAEVEASLQPELEQLRALAERITSDLKRLSASGEDLAELSRDLQAAADASRAIGEALT